MHCFEDLSPALTSGGSGKHQGAAAKGNSDGKASDAANRGGPAGRSTGAEAEVKRETHPNGQPKGNRLERPAYRYGNFPRYYGYRVGQTLEDPRMVVLKEEWFTGKRGLDIGTNEGLIPLSVAVKYRTACFDGIDIDNDLVHKAKVKHRRLQQAAQAAAADAARLHRGQSLPPDQAALAQAVPALANVSFRRGDFVTMKMPEGKYDVVLCLSVSKWVHVNTGDEGLLKLFRRAFECLSPGGVFVLEPQPWSSYRQAFRKQKMPQETVKIFHSLKIRPEHFREILVDRIGFSSVEEVQVPREGRAEALGEDGAPSSSGAVGGDDESEAAGNGDAGAASGNGDKRKGKKAERAGFDRPVLICRKGAGAADGGGGVGGGSQQQQQQQQQQHFAEGAAEEEAEEGGQEDPQQQLLQ